MEKNFIIQKSKTQIIDASKTDAKVEKQLQVYAHNAMILSSVLLTRIIATVV